MVDDTGDGEQRGELEMAVGSFSLLGSWPWPVQITTAFES